MCATVLLALLLRLRSLGALTQHIALLVLNSTLVGQVARYPKVYNSVLFGSILACVKTSYCDETPFAMNGFGFVFELRGQSRQSEIRAGNMFDSELKS